MIPVAPKTPVIAFVPLRLVPPAPVEKVERHLVTQEAVANVGRAVNRAIFEQGLL